MASKYDIDADKAMGTADIFAQILKAKQIIHEHEKESKLKEAPYSMKLNGINIITSDQVPQGSVIVPKEFGDILFTAFTESEEFKKID